MFAMIVIDKTDGKLFIPHDENDKLTLTHSDPDAEKFVAHTYENCLLLGTFPDPTELISIVLKERDGAGKKKNTKKRTGPKRS